MEINFKGPVMPIDPYSQLAFVEILNIITDGRTHRGREPLSHKQERQPAVRFAVRLFQMVVRRRPLHALATHGLQFDAVFQPQDTRPAFRCPGSERQRERQGNGKLKMKRYGNDRSKYPTGKSRSRHLTGSAGKKGRMPH